MHVKSDKFKQIVLCVWSLIVCFSMAFSSYFINQTVQFSVALLLFQTVILVLMLMSSALLVKTA